MPALLRLGLLLAALISIAPAHAQTEDPFGAWISLPDSAQLVYLDASGEAGRIDLPLPDGYAHISPDEVAVSPDGLTAAYVVYRSGYTQPAVAIYGIPQRSLIANFAPAGMLFTSLSVAPLHAFDSGSGQLAVGYATEAGWELAVLDLATFALAARLTDTMPAFAGLPRTPDTLPVPLDFRAGGRLAFVLYDLSVPRASRYPAFVWDIASDTLTPSPHYETPALDVFAPTGEVVRAGADDRLPRSDAFLPLAHYNVVWRYAPSLGTSAPFYVDPIWSIWSVRFVGNGAYLFVSASDGLQYSDALVGRDGRPVAEIAATRRVYDVLGTRTGYLFVTLDEGGAPTVMHAALPGGELATLWTGEAAAAAPRLLWVGAAEAGEPYFTDSGTYTAWGDLAPALGGSGATVSAVDAASTLVATIPELSIGGKATIATSNGDALNVRSDAGTVYQIRAKAQPGEVVDVLDGPRDADGFTWWYVRLADGRAGWAVDFADGTRTLVPGVDSAPVLNPDAPAGPQISSGLAIGDMAEVRLPDTLESLRMRNGAGLQYDIVLLLPEGTLLRVVGGPQDADDLTWWQVRTPEGNVGWAAEVVGSARVLIKQ